MAGSTRGRRVMGTIKVKFSHTRYRVLGPYLIPVHRQPARRWSEVNHAIDLAVGCHYFLQGLLLPPYISPDGATCKRQHTSDSSFTTHLSTQKGWKPSWLTYSGWFTHISGHPPAAGRAQDRKFASQRPTSYHSATPLTCQGCSPKKEEINGGEGVMFSGCSFACACVCVHVRGRSVVLKKKWGDAWNKTYTKIF